MHHPICAERSDIELVPAARGLRVSDHEALKYRRISGDASPLNFQPQHGVTLPLDVAPLPVMACIDEVAVESASAGMDLIDRRQVALMAVRSQVGKITAEVD